MSDNLKAFFEKKNDAEMEGSEHILELQSSGHQKLLLSQLAELRHDSQLCDVILVAKETRINAHRVVLAASSSYFKAMFTLEMVESRLKEVEIKDMEGSTLDALVNFCYSGRITISPINVLSILPACRQLQLDEVQESCCEFLKKELHPLICLGVRAFADTYACGELLRYSYQYILEHFQEIVNTEEFLLLPVEQMVELISRDELRVRSEEKVFEAVIQWVKFDMTERKRFLPRLLEQVRLPLCRPKFLVDTVSEDALVMEDIICRRLLEEAKNYQLVQLSTPVRPDIQGLRTCPRKPSKFNEVLYVVGGLCNREALDSVERLDPGEPDPSWQPVASMTEKGGLGVAVFDNLLYAVGGRNEGEILSSIESYDARRNQWISVAPIGSCRRKLAVSALNSCLYAVGGYDGNACTNVVERLDPRVGKWQMVRPMSTPRCSPGTAVLDGNLYAAGGFGGSIELSSVEKYDPLTNTWTTVKGMNYKRNAIGLAVANESMYAVGGVGGDRSQNTVEVFVPEASQWNLHSSMNDGRSSAGVGVIPMP